MTEEANENCNIDKLLNDTQEMYQNMDEPFMKTARKLMQMLRHFMNFEKMPNECFILGVEISLGCLFQSRNFPCKMLKRLEG